MKFKDAKEAFEYIENNNILFSLSFGEYYINEKNENIHIEDECVLEELNIYVIEYIKNFINEFIDDKQKCEHLMKQVINRKNVLYVNTDFYLFRDNIEEYYTNYINKQERKQKLMKLKW